MLLKIDIFNRNAEDFDQRIQKALKQINTTLCFGFYVRFLANRKNKQK